MVCPTVEAAQRVVQLLKGVAAVAASNSGQKCYCRHSADFLVFDALLAVAAAQESLHCNTLWQHRGPFLYCHGVVLKVLAAKRTALHRSLTAAIEQAALAQPAQAAALSDLLLHFATKQRLKSTLSTVVTLLCRVPCNVRESIASCLTSKDLDSLLLCWEECYNDLAMFVATFNNIQLTDNQNILLLKVTVKQKPYSFSLRAAAQLLTYKNLSYQYLTNIALWAVGAPEEAASEAVDVFYTLAMHGVFPPDNELKRLAMFLPQSPKLFDIYCKAASSGNYSGLDYLESAAQLDNSLIAQHVDLLIKLHTKAIDASLRVCNRPGYRLLWRHIIDLAYSIYHNHRNENFFQVKKFESYRPVLEKLRQEYLDQVLGKCDYSIEDLFLVFKIELDPCPYIGDSEICRADLLIGFQMTNQKIKIDSIHTPCEMATVMQPGLKIDLRKCTLQHSRLNYDFFPSAINILQSSKNKLEIFTVLDAHRRPFDGLQYVKNYLHEAAVYLFDSYSFDQDQSGIKCIYDALGEVKVSELQSPDIPRWKQVAAACTLVSRYGFALDSNEFLSYNRISSPVIEYALALGGSPSDIQRLCEPLGALAPMALCATDNIIVDLDDAVCIARDPRAHELAKYHKRYFISVAICIARNAVGFVKANVSLYELAWILTYYPSL